MYLSKNLPVQNSYLVPEELMSLSENSNQVNTSNTEEEDPNISNSQPKHQQDHDAVVVPNIFSKDTQKRPFEDTNPLE